MKHLVYCILGARPRGPSRLPTGVEGATVSFVSAADLVAAVSRVADADPTPDVAHAAAYAQVIAALAARRTVLPVRYGCLLSTSTQVRELLRRRRTEFAGLLDELDGCVEMGVRAMLTGARGAAARHPGGEGEPGSGAAYLVGRSAAYARRDAERESVAATRTGLRQAFDPLCVQSCASARAVGDRLLVSVQFLVRREHVSAFRRRFRRLQVQQTQGMLLTGPWAPYNFVPARTAGTAS